VVVVHNGIIENYLEIKRELIAAGGTFRSDTDSEVIAHLLAREVTDGTPLEEAVQKVIGNLEGIFAFCAMTVNEPGKIVGTRLGPPLVVGAGEDENFLASDVTALLEHPREVLFIEDRQTVVLTAGKIELYGEGGKPLPVKTQRIAWDPILAEKGGYRHFMLKEIHEQARSVNETMAG